MDRDMADLMRDQERPRPRRRPAASQQIAPLCSSNRARALLSAGSPGGSQNQLQVMVPDGSVDQRGRVERVGAVCDERLVQMHRRQSDRLEPVHRSKAQ